MLSCHTPHVNLQTSSCHHADAIMLPLADSGHNTSSRLNTTQQGGTAPAPGASVTPATRSVTRSVIRDVTQSVASRKASCRVPQPAGHLDSRRGVVGRATTQGGAEARASHPRATRKRRRGTLKKRAAATCCHRRRRTHTHSVSQPNVGTLQVCAGCAPGYAQAGVSSSPS